MSLSTIVGVLGVISADGDRSVINATIGQWTPVILLVNHGLLFGILMWFIKLDGLSLRDIGWTKPASNLRGIGLEVMIGVAAGIVFYILHQYVWQSFVTWLAGGAPTFRMAANSAPLGENVLISVSAGIVLGGFVEEQLYRGYVLSRFTERMSLPVAIVPMLFFFMLLHFGLGWTGMLVAGLTGLMLTLLFIWRRSIYAVVIAHALINTMVLIL